MARFIRLLRGGARIGVIVLVPAALATMVWIAYRGVPKAPDEQLDYYTLWLALFTGVLSVATLALAALAWSQWRDSRAINRAYLSVDPKGLRPWRGQTGRFLGHVAIVNAGTLPAKDMKWFLKAEMSNDGDRRDFIVPADRRGSQLVVGHGKMTRGTPPISLTGDGYCFVWGLVEYDDGYGKRRTTTFCHRYNCARDDFATSLSIDEIDARQHEFGNAAT
jgi:hypothetical protein